MARVNFRETDKDLTHPDLKFTVRPAVVRPRSSIHYCGYSPPRTLGAFVGNVKNMRAALIERMLQCLVSGELKDPLKPVDGVFDRLSWFQDAVVRQMPAGFSPVSLDDFVEMYKGSKKQRYARAVESLREQPLRSRDSEVSAFVKVEKADFSKSARPIQTRDPRYHAVLGRYLKPAEHWFYQAIAKAVGSECVVTKGLNLNGVAEVIRSKWERFKKPVAVGIDATKYDAHVSKDALGFEHNFYNRVFRKPELAEVLGKQLLNRGKAFLFDGKIKYHRIGGRMSGDMNTGLGNCIIMCSIVFGYLRHIGVKAELVNNGDDCVLIMEESDLDTFVAGVDNWFADFGFRLTAEEPCYIFERIEFCQMHPVWVDGGWRMVRKPRVAIEKDTTCILNISDDQYFNWLAGVAACGMAACDGVPVMNAFYKSLQRASAGRTHDFIEDTGMQYLSRGMHASGASVTEEARFSFYLAYGLSPADQVALEASFDVEYDRGTLPDFYPTNRPLDVPYSLQRLYPSTET